MFKFYLPQNNPANLTGTVGGAISTVPLSGYLDELLLHVDAPPGDSASVFYQYRKVYITNEFSTESTDTHVWLDAVQHPEQITLALEGSANQSISNAITEPLSVTSWSSPSNYAEGLDLGDLSAGASAGIWIRELLTDISQSDPYATFRLVVGGLIQ